MMGTTAVEDSQLPLAYGYLRIDLLSGEVADWEHRLVEVSRGLGVEVAAVFRESSPQGTVPPAYLELVHECCRTGAHIVITAPGHLSGMAIPHTCLLDILAIRAGARVCEVSL
ncbi:hypothetical protein ACIP5Y_12725 [Nocardia sp. NPDC088792]|uniref:hypothetical protein n=1 Tax=Nocardia sp. NPDC088792 TaxID=3364332 RepID=UPI00380E083C